MGSDRKRWNQQISSQSAARRARRGFEIMQTGQIENRGGDYYFCAVLAFAVGECKIFIFQITSKEKMLHGNGSGHKKLHGGWMGLFYRENVNKHARGRWQRKCNTACIMLELFILQGL